MAILLAITVVLPVLGSLGLVLTPRLDDRRARTIALGIAAATLVFSLILLAGFRSEIEGPQFAVVTAEGRYGVSWMGTPQRLGTPDIRFALGLDGLSLWLFVLTSLLMITAICSSWDSIT